jgi:hypothetical protein
MEADKLNVTRQIGKSMPYFANMSQRGQVKYHQLPGSIGVHDSRDNAMPIGQTDCKTWDENGLAVWTLSTGGQPIESRWVIIDREFKPEQ